MGRKRLSEKERQAYLEGLKRYHRKGIPIYIDDEELAESEWDRIFEIQEDGSFYMSDYVGADTGRLTEIRFDKVKYK